MLPLSHYSVIFDTKTSNWLSLHFPQIVSLLTAMDNASFHIPLVLLF